MVEGYIGLGSFNPEGLLVAGTLVGRVGSVGVESGFEWRWGMLWATLEKDIFSSGFLFPSPPQT